MIFQESFSVNILFTYTKSIYNLETSPRRT